MKQTLFVLFALFILIGATNAQDSTPKKDNDKTLVQAQDRVFQVEHLLYVSGKVYRSHQRQLTTIDGPVRLQNGTVVNPNGSYQLPDQKRRRLQEGECLDLEGNRYANLTDFSYNIAVRPSLKERKAQKVLTQNQNGSTGDKKS